MNNRSSNSPFCPSTKCQTMNVFMSADKNRRREQSVLHREEASQSITWKTDLLACQAVACMWIYYSHVKDMQPGVLTHRSVIPTNSSEAAWRWWMFVHRICFHGKSTVCVWSTRLNEMLKQTISYLTAAKQKLKWNRQLVWGFALPQQYCHVITTVTNTSTSVVHQDVMRRWLIHTWPKLCISTKEKEI